MVDNSQLSSQLSLSTLKDIDELLDPQTFKKHQSITSLIE